MPLQNRVDPFGNIVATSARGAWMGNRGILHDSDKRLGNRRWGHKAWICCVLEFRGRHREVMTPQRYTELFFFDEATALAAGHRPCAECRRADYRRFVDAWTAAHMDGGAAPPRAADIDARLHTERVERYRGNVTHQARAELLPDGVFVRPAHREGAWIVTGPKILRWSHEGYDSSEERPSGAVEVLTPPSIVETIRCGYRPQIGRLHIDA